MFVMSEKCISPTLRSFWHLFVSYSVASLRRRIVSRNLSTHIDAFSSDTARVSVLMIGSGSLSDIVGAGAFVYQLCDAVMQERIGVNIGVNICVNIGVNIGVNTYSRKSEKVLSKKRESHF